MSLEKTGTIEGIQRDAVEFSKQRKDINESQIGNGINAPLLILCQLFFKKAHISPDGYLNESPAEEDDNQTKPSRQVHC